MRLVLVGAGGQLGTAVQSSAPEWVQLQALTRRDLDITDPTRVSETIRELSPDVIVNAAAYTLVDRAESEEDVAREVNAVGARNLAEAIRRSGARLIQISTDFVFAGDVPVPYSVDASPAPVNAYGRTKLAGERAVIDVLGPRAVVLRTAWLYAQRGRNFVTTMLTAMSERESLSVVVDQIGSPTWAQSLADAIWRAARDPGVFGIHHWSDLGVASWYDFSIAIQEEALARRLLEKQIPIRPIRTEDYPTAARRPRYSVLDTRRTLDQLGCEAVHWRSNLRLMLDELADV